MTRFTKQYGAILLSVLSLLSAKDVLAEDLSTF